MARKGRLTGGSMPVRFVRTKNRTVSDILRSPISGRLERSLDSTAQKIVHYSRTNHRYQNRTGALEGSLSWTPVIRTHNGFSTTVFAGGESVVRFAFDFARRVKTGVRRRNVRYSNKGRILPKRGALIFVNYARYVEDKGYPVLKQGIDHFRNRISGFFRQDLQRGSLN